MPLTKRNCIQCSVDPATIVIDVREKAKHPEAIFQHIKIPLSTFDSFPEMQSSKISLYFARAERSVKAAGDAEKKIRERKTFFTWLSGLTAYNKKDHE
jgi:rhodanese-related sulfurtransferase